MIRSVSRLTKRWLCPDQEEEEEKQMASQDFNLLGPSHLSFVDWTNADHRRSVAASLVQGVHILERDRHHKRQGPEALAPPWWEFFHFQLLLELVDDADSSIFGAIYEYKLPPDQDQSNLHSNNDNSPRYVIAFRGTTKKEPCLLRDLELNLQIISNGLHETSRFEIAIEAVEDLVATVGESNVWLAGYSLGSAMALLAGKIMAKRGIFIQTFLFNSPFISVPIEIIRHRELKLGFRTLRSMIKGVVASAATLTKNQYNQGIEAVDPFKALSEWFPCLFVNPDDHICAEYIGYFEHRKKMEEIGIGGIERLATKNSFGGHLMSVIGKEIEPLHLLPSANLTVNLTPTQDFTEAHGICQWWRPHLKVQSKLYKYE